MKKYFKNILLYFDRSFSKGTVNQILWLLGIMLVVYVVLIILSYLHQFYSTGTDGSNGRWYDVIFTLIDPGSGTPSMSSLFTILCALLGLVFFSGMLISVISNVLERRVDSYVKGETTYNRLSDHVVVLGKNKSLPSLLRTISKDHPDSFIALMSETNSEELRDFIHANVKKDIEKKVIVMNGVRNAEDDLKRLNWKKNVKEVYILGEENEQAHDSINMECFEMIVRKIPESAPRIKCHVELLSRTMYDVLKTVDIKGEIKNNISFAPFNFNEIWAQKALATMPCKKMMIDDDEQKWKYLPLDDKGITIDSKKRVHLVVIGMSDMGLSLAINAAHIMHYPNFKENDNNSRSRITFIDKRALTKGYELRCRHQALFDLMQWRQIGKKEQVDTVTWLDPMTDAELHSPYKGLLGDVNFLDQQWEFVEGILSDASIVDYLDKCADDSDEILTIAFCHDSSERNAQECMMLSDNVMRKVHQVLVRQKESPTMINLLRMRPGYEKIKPFGIESECYYNEVINEKYGKLVNGCYYGLDINNADEVQNVWDGQSVANKWSSIYCANMFLTKLRFIGLDTDKSLNKQEIDDAVTIHMEDSIIPTEHNRWNIEKLLMGFQPPRSKEDQKKWQSKSEKKEMKRAMLHLDISSNKTLMMFVADGTEPDDVIDYDRKVNWQLSKIYEIAEEYLNREQ